MIEIVENEYLENDKAIFKRVLYFLGMKIYSVTTSTTKSDIVRMYKKIEKPSVKGFKNA